MRNPKIKPILNHILQNKTKTSPKLAKKWPIVAQSSDL